MRIGKSSNPILNADRLRTITDSYNSEGVMTVNGTINKTLILFGILFASAFLTWQNVNETNFFIFIVGGIIGGLVAAIITAFKPVWSAITAPIYALFEGMALGALSQFYSNFMDGIVVRAIGLTLAILFVMLALYRSGVLRATPKFKKGVIVATAGVFFFYLLNWIGSWFGFGLSLGNMGWLGIGIQFAIVVIASMNLVLDFDSIENGAESSLPKYAEWYSAFGLMVTLVWLYMEMLRLLALLSGRD